MPAARPVDEEDVSEDDEDVQDDDEVSDSEAARKQSKKRKTPSFIDDAAEEDDEEDEEVGSCWCPLCACACLPCALSQPGLSIQRAEHYTLGSKVVAVRSYEHVAHGCRRRTVANATKSATYS